jgi:hypothetical protein
VRGESGRGSAESGVVLVTAVPCHSRHTIYNHHFSSLLRSQPSFSLSRDILKCKGDNVHLSRYKPVSTSRDCCSSCGTDDPIQHWLLFFATAIKPTSTTLTLTELSSKFFFISTHLKPYQNWILQDRRPSPANDVSSPTSNFARRDPRLDITEDSPPPYTPAPSTVEGEQTLEYGPNRPFQPPPAPPTAPHSAGYPGNHSHSAFLFPPGSHATASPTVQRVVGVLNDLYNATRQQSWHGSTGPPGQFPSGNHGPPPPQNAHPPLNSLPTGPPPLPRSPRPNIEQNGEQQDPAHTPTTTPMAGHPLLRDGNVLIYPQGFTCYKCTSPPSLAQRIY